MISFDYPGSEMATLYMDDIQKLIKLSFWQLLSRTRELVKQD